MGRASVRHTSNRSKCTTLSLKLTMPKGGRTRAWLFRSRGGVRVPHSSPLTSRRPALRWRLTAGLFGGERWQASVEDTLGYLAKASDI